jgi:hypothetical protein
MAAPIAAQTDMLVTVPSVIMHSARDVYDLERRDVPFELPQMGLSVFRSATDGDELGFRWFVEQVEAACHKLSVG